MSTFLVSLGVTTAAIACVTWLAVREANQPATKQSHSRRAYVPPSTPSPTPAPALLPVLVPAPPGAPGTAVPHRSASRLRAGLGLCVLVTLVGVVMALAVSAAALLAVQGLRDSVR